MRDAPPTRYTRNGDVHLGYQVIGEGPDDLVLVWAGPNHLDLLWESPPVAAVLQRMATFSRLIHFDQRGTGLSDRVPIAELPTLEQRADDIGAVMDAAGSERAVVLGEGEGGLPAMLFAATHPERVVGLVLWGSGACGTPDDDYPWAPGPELVGAYLDAMEESWGEPFGIELLFPSKVADEPFRDWWARHIRAAASPSAARAFTEMSAATDVRPILPTIHTPTLVMHRSGDMLFGVEGGRYLVRAIPDARLVEVPGDDHMFWADDEEVFGPLEEFVTGRPAQPRINRVLVTLLFTDIVGSTEQAARLGDQRWKALLHQHYEAARGSLARESGTLVKTTGDGLLARFDAPGRAMRSAAAIRDAARSMGIELRAGLHIGEVEVIGDDVAGLGVHVAQRIQSLAGSGEILVSSTMKDLVAGSGLVFEDRGEHALRGVPGSWHVYALGPNGA